MREMIVGKNWVNLVVAIGLAIVPLLVTVSKHDNARATHAQIAAVQVAEAAND